MSSIDSENYYENWLSFTQKGIAERKHAKKIIYPEELKWVKTRMDHKSALLVSPETGFQTLGGVTYLAEIPKNSKTGKHYHGEEAMYITKGKGFSIINNQQFNWEQGSCIRIPFGATHQHFNLGPEPVEYFSAMAPHFERFFSLSKSEHFEDCGSYTIDESRLPKSIGDYDSKGRRLVMHKDQALAIQKASNDKNMWMMSMAADIAGDEVNVTGILMDQPRLIQEKHAHMEAILYILEGEGYSIIDGEKFPWKPGTAIHVQGPQTVHQHFTTSNIPSLQVRTQFAFRNYLQSLAKDVFPYLHHLEGDQFLKPF